MKIESAWNRWGECLEDRDRNSILNQITSIIWDAGIYQLILECRKCAIDGNGNLPKYNGPLHNFIDRNFFERQASAIRRLTDKYPLYGNKGVVSLNSLIQDIKSFRSVLNREKYLQLRNIPYDIKMLRTKQTEFLKNHSKHTGMAILIPDEYSPERSIDAHEFFDSISQVDSKDRQPDDLISISFIARVENKLKRCDDLKMYVDKFIAHASSRESRELDNYQSTKITLQHLWEIHKTFCETVDFLSQFVSGIFLEFLPVEQPDFYDYWDHPLIDTKNIEQLNIIFNKYRQETSTWRFDLCTIE